MCIQCLKRQPIGYFLVKGTEIPLSKLFPADIQGNKHATIIIITSMQSFNREHMKHIDDYLIKLGVRSID